MLLVPNWSVYEQIIDFRKQSLRVVKVFTSALLKISVYFTKRIYFLFIYFTLSLLQNSRIRLSTIHTISFK